MDPELRDQLDRINQSLTEITKKRGGTGLLKSFFMGIFSALGYVAGLAVVVVIIGWVLQKTGLLQPFEARVKDFTELMDAARGLVPQNSTSSPSNQEGSRSQGGNGRETTVTLPNGQTVKVFLPEGN